MTTATITKTAAAEATAKITENKNSTNLETRDHPNKEERWTQVTRKKNKKTPVKSSTATTTIAEAKATTLADITAVPTYIAVAAIIQTPTSSKKKKKKQHPLEEQPEDMETTTNLKRRRESGDTNKEGKKK